MDCGPTCLRIIAKHLGKHFSVQTLRERAQATKEGVSLLGIAQAAESIGLTATGVNISLEELIGQMPLPCILHWGQAHFVVLYRIKRPKSQITHYLTRRKNSIPPPKEGLTFYIADPSTGLVSYQAADFCRKWLNSGEAVTQKGIALAIEPTPLFESQQDEPEQGWVFGPILKYIWQYKKLLLQLLLGLVAGSIFSLSIPLLTQSLVDKGIGTKSLSFVTIVLIAQLALLLSSAGVDFLRSWILLYISTRVNVSILTGVVSKLLRLPISFFDVKLFGDIMQRMNDHHRIETFLTGQSLNILFSLINLILFGAMLAYYHLMIFAVALGASILYGIWVVSFLKRRRKLDTARFEVSSRSQSQMVHMIQGMQDVKLSGAETLKQQEWEQTQAKLFNWSQKHLSFLQSQQTGALLINNGKNILITFLAAKSVINADLTLGAMVSIQYILAQFNAPVDQMMGLMQSWQDAQTSLERLEEIHQVPNEERASETHPLTWEDGRNILIRNLYLRYPGAGNDHVLKNINLTIPFGKTTAIVGSSGSGKTTLLKLLLRFYNSSQGGIYLGSGPDHYRQPINIDEFSHSAWRLNCGVVMQEGFIFSDTIARNIAVADQQIDEQRLRRAAKIANIDDFVQSLPMSYQTKIGSEGGGISQGQKQRILIARAVYKNPGILLFDEATNALDASNEAIIMQNLKQFSRGRTVVVVAHRLSTVKNADQIIVLEKGELVEAGTHQELAIRKGKYAELVSNQLPLAVE